MASTAKVAPVFDEGTSSSGAERQSDIKSFQVELKLEEEIDGPSPVPEVELTVPKGDDPTIPYWTFRMWLIGTLVCATMAFFNQFFSFRSEPLMLSNVVAQVVALPLGHFLARVLPTSEFTIPFFDITFSLNPGPFNLKEHVLITVFANCAAGYASAVDIVTIMRQFYKQAVDFWGAALLVLTTQCLGYGWAGLLRKTLVEPAHFWWPSTLVSVAFLHALHSRETCSNGTTRIKYFIVVALCSFCWYLVPGYLAIVVTSISWVCWLYPNNVTAHQLGGGLRGLGIGAFSLDWATVTSFLGSPLVTPWHVILNAAAGFILMTWVIMPTAYWGVDLYNASRFPIQSAIVYTESGDGYPTLSMLTSKLELNTTRYEEVGPLSMSTFFAVGYGLGFATLTATLSHVALWHGKEVWQRSRAAVHTERLDHHSILMRRYPSIPVWWFVLLLVATTTLSIYTVETYHYQLPWWGVLTAILMAFVFTLPVAILASTTGTVVGLNIITEMLIGYWLPGKPVANVVFKIYGYISVSHAIAFIRDFKLGHYMKIPPRAIFVVQIAGTLIAGLVNLSVAFWLYDTVDHICVTDKLPGSSPWTCPQANVFYSASIIWGVIGPNRVFGWLGKYKALNWFFLLGFLAPVPFYLLAKWFPRKRWLTKVNVPVVLAASTVIPPASPVNFTSWILVGFIFQYVIFRHRPRWWARYNYITSVALDTGVAFMGLLIFLAFQSYNTDAVWNLNVQNWWVNANHDQCPLATCPTAPGINRVGCPATRSGRSLISSPSPFEHDWGGPPLTGFIHTEL